MNGQEVKELMEQIHISEQMQEEMIMNVQKRMENKKKKMKTWKKVAAAAAVMLVAGVVSIPVKAMVSSLVTARMESIPKEEVQVVTETIQKQEAVADGYSREYSDEEKERRKKLEELYKNGTFPEQTILQVDSIEDVTEETLSYVKATGDFYLPERELTDEELLEIIDWENTMRYAIEQSPAAKEVRAEMEAEDKRLREKVQAEGGISEEDAIEIARKQMESELGEKAEGKELLTDIYGCGAFLEDISAHTSYEHERDVAYNVGFGNPNNHSTYTCIIDAVDGSILKTTTNEF